MAGAACGASTPAQALQFLLSHSGSRTSGVVQLVIVGVGDFRRFYTVTSDGLRFRLIANTWRASTILTNPSPPSARHRHDVRAKSARWRHEVRPPLHDRGASRERRTCRRPARRRPPRARGKPRQARAAHHDPRTSGAIVLLLRCHGALVLVVVVVQRILGCPWHHDLAIHRLELLVGQHDEFIAYPKEAADRQQLRRGSFHPPR